MQEESHLAEGSLVKDGEDSGVGRGSAEDGSGGEAIIAGRAPEDVREPNLSRSYETLNSAETDVTPLDDSEPVNFVPPLGHFYTQASHLNIIRNNNVFFSVHSSVRTRQTPQRQEASEHFALALLNKPCPNYGMKCKEILKFITKNHKSADLKLSLYMAASEVATLLKPFPMIIVDENEEGLSALSLINEEVPSIQLLQHYLKNPEEFRISDAVVSLLHWILIYHQDPRIVSLPTETFYSIFQKVQNGINFQEPTHIFKLMYNRASTSQCQWQAMVDGRRSALAFYGGSLKSLHSLLHLGFYPTVHRDGLYFYTDIKYCLDIIPEEGWCWGKSELGSKIKVVLVVEIIEDESTKSGTHEYIAVDKELRAITDGTEEQVCTYYCVKNSQFLRIRYILVYAKRNTRSRLPVVPLVQRPVNRWLTRNKKLIFVFGSVVLAALTTRYLQNKYILNPIIFHSRAPFIASPISTI